MNPHRFHVALNGRDAYDLAMRYRRDALHAEMIRHQTLEPLRLAGMVHRPHDRVNLPTIQEMIEKYPRSLSAPHLDNEYRGRHGMLDVEVRAMFDVMYRMPLDLHEYLESLKALKGL